MKRRRGFFLIAAAMIVLFMAQGLGAESLFKKKTTTPPIQPPTSNITRQKAPTATQPGLTVPQPQTVFPELVSVAPSTVQQGQTAVLTLNGRNLSTDMTLTMGDGVTTEPPQQVSDTLLLVPVSVSGTAAPGARTINVQYKGQTKASRARLNITAAPSATLLQTVTPNTIAQGQSKDLTVTGTGLDFVRQMNFGPGIKVDQLTPTGPTLRVRVSAAPDAAPGRRTISYSDRQGQHSSRLQFTVTTAQSIVAPETGALSVVAPASTAASTDNPNALALVPNQWEQGDHMEVVLQGANFPKSMQVRLDEGVHVEKVSVDSASRARLVIRVEDTARLGAHRLDLRPGKDTQWLQTRTMAFVKAPPSIPPVATVEKDSLTALNATQIEALQAQILDVTPGQWERGKAYEVTLRGTNLRATLEGRFGPGINITALSVTSETSAAATITVADTAAMGRHLLEIRDKKDTQWRDSRAAGVVLEEKKEIKRPDVLTEFTPTLSGLTPNRWYPGEKYQVTVFGDRFAEGMDVNLGAGILVADLKVASPTKATMTVAVDGKATPGPRPLKTRQPRDPSWKDTGLSGLVKQVYTTTVPPLVAQPTVNATIFAKGKINLKLPEYGKFVLMENAIGDHGIPKTTDETRFVWLEESQGQSQWFELRIVDKAGTVRMKRTIKSLPLPDTFYHPDADFITELFTLFRPESGSNAAPLAAQTTTPQQPAQISSQAAKLNLGGPGNQNASAPSELEQYLNDHAGEIECFWEVAGFKSYTSQSYPPGAQQGGFQKSKPVTVSTNMEVAISERWPLKLPAFSPTGLACSKANTQLDYRKTNYKPGEAVTDESIYVGDTVQVSGEILLDECPWKLEYDMVWGELTGAHYDPNGYNSTYGTTDVKAWKFRNLFIDWGDGSYDLLSANPTQSTYIVGPAQTDATVRPTGKLFITQTHVYRYSNKFPIRVFVLPAEDVGTIGSIVQSSKAPEPPAATASINPPQAFPVLLAKANTVVSDAGAGLAQGVTQVPANVHIANFEPPGGRAFLLYCNPQIIDIKADPAAIGPLHLEKIEITGFSGQDSANGPQHLQGQNTAPGSQQLQDVNVAPGAMTAANTPKPAAIKPQANLSTQNANLQKKTGSDLGVAQVAPVNTGLLAQADAQASSCDAAFFAKAKLTYYGTGKLILRWKVDGTIIEESTISVGPSPIRSTLKDDNTYAQDILRAEQNFVSPSLPLEVTQAILGKRTVTVEAALAPGEKKYVTYYQQVGSVQIPINLSDQLDQVVSDPRTYVVTAPKEGEPCVFRFPVADGKHFLITGLQGRATNTNGVWSGRGTLLFDLPDSSSGQATRFVDIDFQSWTVAEDGTVQSGEIKSANLGQTFDQLPGVSVTLQALQGTAGQELKATLDVKVKDGGIRVVESGGAQTPAWIGVSAPLVPESGWYAAGQKLPLTQIGWSLFQIESEDVRLDLSRGQGTDPAPLMKLKLSALSKSAPAKTPHAAQTSGVASDAPSFQSSTGWVGVHLGENAVLHPYLFHLADMTVPAKNWRLTDNGIAGAAHFGQFSNVLGAGSIEFDGIDIVAGNNQIEATYENVRVKVPWPAMTLSGGSASLVYSQGQANAEVGLHFDTAGLAVTEDYGKVIMKTQVKEFLHRASGWGITTDTSFTFKDEKREFVTVMINDLFFNMDGVALFAQDATSQSFGLNAKTQIGDVEANLHSMQATAATDRQGADRLDFTLKGDINFPALSSADVDVMYAVKKPLGQNYQATGPKHSKFTTGISYPDGRPMADTSIMPEIKESGSGMAGEQALYASLDPLVVADGSGGGVQDTFSGTVDMKMFGMGDSAPGVAFRYGTYNGNGYWLTHVNVSGLSIPIYTGVILYGINGGLAYGFSSNAYQGNPMSATPNNPGKMVYTAGITVSSAQPDVIQLGGQLTVIPEDVVIRMGFNKVVLLSYPLNGGGFFEYGNGAFKGKVWGNLSLFGGAVSISAPQGAENDLGSSGLYFSSDDWQIYCGRPESPISAHFLIADGMGFMHLGKNVGLKVGGGLNISSGKICLGIGAAEAHLNTLVGMNVTPSAHLSADFKTSAGVSAWVPSCSGKKFSFDRSIDVHAEAMPVHLKAGFTVDCGWFGSKSFSVTLI
jgi:hypothetical protein